MAIASTIARPLGPDSAGARLTPREFDRADFAEGWRYELINGVLVVSPIPSIEERGPNDYFGHLLWQYREEHPLGAALDATTTEHTVITKRNRRRADRVIWAGLGRPPGRKDTPTVIAEFVSRGKRDRQRDYGDKREEYMKIAVSEYWIIDRFQRTMTVWFRQGRRIRKRVIKETEIYTTTLLPGFKLPLARLLKISDEWRETTGDEPGYFD